MEIGPKLCRAAVAALSAPGCERYRAAVVCNQARVTHRGCCLKGDAFTVVIECTLMLNSAGSILLHRNRGHRDPPGTVADHGRSRDPHLEVHWSRAKPPILTTLFVTGRCRRQRAASQPGTRAPSASGRRAWPSRPWQCGGATLPAAAHAHEHGGWAHAVLTRACELRAAGQPVRRASCGTAMRGVPACTDTRRTAAWPGRRARATAASLMSLAGAARRPSTLPP